MRQIVEGFERLRLDVHSVVRQFRQLPRRAPRRRSTSACCKQGVIVRPIGGYGMPEHLRVTIGLRIRERALPASAAGRRCTPETSSELVTDVRFRKLAVFGVGLIGGSFALALKQAGAVRRSRRCRPQPGESRARTGARRDRRDRGSDCSARADRRRSGAGRRSGRSRPSACCRRSRRHLAPDAVVTDGGSTKRDVVAAARSALGAKLAAVRPGASDRGRRAVRRGGRQLPICIAVARWC